MKTITYANMIHVMDQVNKQGEPVPFSCRFVTADRKRNTGGEIIEIKKAIKVVGKKRDGSLQYTTTPKNPRHWDNATRNIAVLPGKNIRKVHTRLIIQFNGMNIIP